MKKSNRITLYAVSFAVIFVAMILDRLMSLALPISMATFVLLVTFSVAFIYNKWDMAVAAGLFFGLSSWLKTFIFGNANIFDINPLVPILPRVIALTVAFAVYKLVLFLYKERSAAARRQTVAIIVATFFGLALNTLLYLSALNISNQLTGKEYQSIFATIVAVIFTNIIPEYLVSLIFTPLVVLGVRRGLKLGTEAKFTQIEAQQ
jgi:uncharacterized membrane protein